MRAAASQHQSSSAGSQCIPPSSSYAEHNEVVNDTNAFFTTIALRCPQNDVKIPAGSLCANADVRRLASHQNDRWRSRVRVNKCASIPLATSAPLRASHWPTGVEQQWSAGSAEVRCRQGGRHLYKPRFPGQNTVLVVLHCRGFRVTFFFYKTFQFFCCSESRFSRLLLLLLLLLLLDLLQGWYPTLSDYTYFGVFGHLVTYTRDMTCAVLNSVHSLG